MNPSIAIGRLAELQVSQLTGTWRVVALPLLGSAATLALAALLTSLIRSDRSRTRQGLPPVKRPTPVQILILSLATVFWVAGWWIVTNDSHRYFYWSVWFEILLLALIMYGVARSLRRTERPSPELDRNHRVDPSNHKGVPNDASPSSPGGSPIREQHEHY
jgi:uncharacterized membrane protein YfcA